MGRGRRRSVGIEVVEGDGGEAEEEHGEVVAPLACISQRWILGVWGDHVLF